MRLAGEQRDESLKVTLFFVPNSDRVEISFWFFYCIFAPLRTHARVHFVRWNPSFKTTLTTFNLLLLVILRTNFAPTSDAWRFQSESIALVMCTLPARIRYHLPFFDQLSYFYVANLSQCWVQWSLHILVLFCDAFIFSLILCCCIHLRAAHLASTYITLNFSVFKAIVNHSDCQLVIHLWKWWTHISHGIMDFSKTVRFFVCASNLFRFRFTLAHSLVHIFLLSVQNGI